MSRARVITSRTLEQLRRVRLKFERMLEAEQQRRRAEDRIREELHDQRAVTINGKQPK